MKEDLYHNIERYTNGEMDGEEAAAFRRQIDADESLADEVWVHQRLQEELGDARKRALRDTLSQLSTDYVPAQTKRVGLRSWLPVLISSAAAVVALYLLIRTPNLSPTVDPAGEVADIPVEPKGPIAETVIPSDIPATFNEKSMSSDEQQRLRLRFAQQAVNPSLETSLYQAADGYAITITQPAADEILVPASEQDKAFAIKGNIRVDGQQDLEQLQMVWQNASQEVIGQLPLVINKGTTEENPEIRFYVNWMLPEATGWYYYQIQTADQQVVYTGKTGVWQE